MTETDITELNRETRRANPKLVMVPFQPGQRVAITRGGFAGDTGTVRHIRQLESTGQFVYTITLHSGCLFIGGSREIEAL